MPGRPGGGRPGPALSRAAAAGRASRLTDADVRAPSLPPSRSRAHVPTHPARNADGWAGPGRERRRPSTRDERIAAGAGRSAAELLADLRCSAAEFEPECRRTPPEARHRTVRWTRGQERLAARAARRSIGPRTSLGGGARRARGRPPWCCTPPEPAPRTGGETVRRRSSAGRRGPGRADGARRVGAAGRALPPLASSARTGHVPAVESLGGRSARSVDPSHFCAVRVRLEAPGRCGSLTTHQHMWGYRRG
ncbi:maleylpyruvate isomerase N-terminal domain-containing protein [Kitasatospora griseola]|uniref:maleylpyruvate isomerase N-terminal domain-containing protein n=1 Tax=Kitasatospora griseola TaxID=2064 RepID=UPI0034347DB5